MYLAATKNPDLTYTGFGRTVLDIRCRLMENQLCQFMLYQYIQSIGQNTRHLKIYYRRRRETGVGTWTITIKKLKDPE